MFGRVGEKGDVAQEKLVGLASQGGLGGKRGQQEIEIGAIFIECIGSEVDRAGQFRRLQGRLRLECRRHLVQAIANALQSLNGDRCKRGRRTNEVCFGGLQNFRDVFYAGENLPAARLIIGPGYGERLNDRGERLLDVKGWIAFPARVDIEFPMDAGDGRSDQAVIHLVGNGPAGGIERLPFRLEFGQLCPPLRESGGGPVAGAARALESINVVAGEGRGAGAPSPEVGAEFLQRGCLRAGGGLGYGKGYERDEERRQ